MRVAYSGGCQTHHFSLHAPRCFLESYPIQSDIFLAHDDADDPCDALVEQELLFDLTPLKQEYLKTYRGSDGPIILRIYPPGTRDPVEPRPRYEFTAS